MRYKYKFTVVYATKEMQKACEFMKKLDLDIGEVGIQQSFSFSSERNIEIPALKELISHSFESDCYKILHIEGGKIE